MAARYRFDDPEIRRRLSQPLGELIQEEEAARRARSCSGIVITVGDVVSEALLSRGVAPQIVIYDERTRREPRKSLGEGLLAEYDRQEARNPAGTVSEEAFNLLKRLIRFRRKSAVKILGEEDLLGLPAIAASPVGSLVLYGQPGAGIVAVAVDRGSKATAKSILDMSKVPAHGH